MTLSLRDDIALLTDEKKGFRPKNREVAPKDFTERYSNDGVSDKFDSPSFRAEAEAKKKQKRAAKDLIENYKLFTETEIKTLYDSIDKAVPYNERKATMYLDTGKPSPDMMKKFRNTRLKCQFMMAYTMGLRRSELANTINPDYAFKWADINLQEGTVKVLGKNNKKRTVFIPPSALIHMREWYDLASKVNPDFKKSQYVFPAFDQYGNVDVNKPMTDSVFYRDLKRLSNAAGIQEERLRPHVLRHSYASHLFMHGVPIESIQSQLGHARVETTRVYQHITNEFRRRTMINLDPSGKTQTAEAKPKGVMGQGSTKTFNTFLETLDEEQKSQLRDILHSFRDGKDRIFLTNEIAKFGEEYFEVIDQEAQRLKRGQVPGAINTGPSAAKQTSEGVFKPLNETPLNNDMDAKIAQDRYNATLPVEYDDRSRFEKGKFGPSFDVKVNPKGADLILDIAKRDNLNIAQAYNKLVTSIETTHFRLGDTAARKKFKDHINELFPQGIGRPGQKVLFDPPNMPKGMIADSFEHHVIAQNLFDRGKLVDGDPVRTTGGRRAGLFKYAQEKGGVNKNGELKSKGSPGISGFIGNQIQGMEARGGEYYWSSFDVDKKTGQKVYLPLMDSTGIRPAKVYPYLMPELSGYKISDAEAKVKPSPLPAWARQIPSPEQFQYFKDMRRYDEILSTINRLPEEKQVRAAERELGVIQGRYDIDKTTGVPNRFPEFVPELRDTKKELSALNASFNTDLDQVDVFSTEAAIQQAETPDTNKILPTGKRVENQVPTKALFTADQGGNLDFRGSADKSELGKALDKLSRGTAKALPFAALGYTTYEIAMGKPAVAAIAEALTPMVLDASPAYGGRFFEEQKRQRQIKELEIKKEEELFSADEMAMQDIRAQEAIAKEQSRVRGLGRLASGVVSGVASFFDREDEPKTETKDDEEVENPGPLQVTINPGAYINR